MVPQRILVATDGSDSARRAEVFAADLAGLMQHGEVVCAMVIRPTDLASVRGAALMPSSAVEVSDTEAALAESVARVRAVAAAGVTVRGVVIEALSPAKGIIDEAHADGTCSLIVMGNRGHGGFSSLVLGSVSTQVLHGAHCPVVIVK
jgi:nucleotide-binding universal stress UspA family protein